MIRLNVVLTLNNVYVLLNNLQHQKYSGSIVYLSTACQHYTEKRAKRCTKGLFNLITQKQTDNAINTKEKDQQTFNSTQNTTWKTKDWAT